MTEETKLPSSGASAPIFAQIEDWELLFVYDLRIKDTYYYAVLKLFDGYVLIETMQMEEITKKVYGILTGDTNPAENDTPNDTPFIAGKGTSAEAVFWSHLVEDDPDRRHVTHKDIVDYVNGVDKVTNLRYCQKDGHALQFIKEFITVFLQKHFLQYPIITITHEVV